MRRIFRFLNALRWLGKHHLLNRHNLRAAWIQSNPDWLDKLPQFGITDEEWQEFAKALDIGTDYDR